MMNIPLISTAENVPSAAGQQQQADQAARGLQPGGLNPEERFGAKSRIFVNRNEIATNYEYGRGGRSQADDSSYQYRDIRQQNNIGTAQNNIGATQNNTDTAQNNIGAAQINYQNIDYLKVIAEYLMKSTGQQQQGQPQAAQLNKRPSYHDMCII